MAKEFIVYSPTKALFEAQVASGEVDNTQIGIIAESGEFWENGNYHPLILLTDYLKKTDAVTLAKDLTGRIEATSEEFTFRPSAGDKSIRDESAVIRRIKGNTSMWGQLAEWTGIDNKGQSSLATYEISDKSLDITYNTAGAPPQVYIFSSPLYPAVTGHKYLCTIDIKTSKSLGLMLYPWYDVFLRFTSNQSWTTHSAFYTPTRTEFTNRFYLRFQTVANQPMEVGDSIHCRNLQFFDLTQIFGAGNEPTTIEEFKKLYPESYYPYCELEVRSMRATGIETIGANAFNKDSVVGGLINADGTVTSNDIYSVAKIEVVPYEKYTLTNVANAANTTYTYALYDSNDRFISVGEIKNSVTKPVSVSGDVTMPLNARYIRVVVHNDYLDNCCVNLKHSGTLTAEEAVYFKEIRMLPDIAKYFPDGMHGIGEVYDEINEENAVKRFGVVDLGTLTWASNATSSSTGGLRRWTTSSIKSVFPTGTGNYEKSPNMVCLKYPTGSINSTFRGELSIACGSGGDIFLFDPEYTSNDDKDAFVASLQGILLYYELAEPIVTPITEPLQLDYKVADFGTEKMVAMNPSSPFRADIVYAFNAEGRIRDNSRNIERLENIVDSVKDDEGYLYSNGDKVDMRFTRSLIPVGTSIPAKANLNTVAYLKVGKYYCSLNADAKTITNCPTANAFMMEVFNPLSTVVDNEVDSTYVYRIRILTEYSTGIQYFQYCTVGSTVNRWTYDSWYVCPRTKFTLNSSKNDGTAAIGSKTLGVYVDSTGTLQKMTYALNKTVPSNAVFTDTDTKVTAVDNHYTPVEDESAGINAPDGEVVVGLKRDATGHVVGVVTTTPEPSVYIIQSLTLADIYDNPDRQIQDDLWSKVGEGKIIGIRSGKDPIDGYSDIVLAISAVKDDFLYLTFYDAYDGNIVQIDTNKDGTVEGIYSYPFSIEGVVNLLQNVAAFADGGIYLKQGFIADPSVIYALPTSANGYEDDIIVTTGTLRRINGTSLYGSSQDDITISPQLPTTIIRDSISSPTMIYPGRVVVCKVPLTTGGSFTFSSPTTDVVDEVWAIRFSIDEANVGDVSVIPFIGYTIKWANGIAPTFENGKYYELSFRVIGKTYLGVWASFE